MFQKQTIHKSLAVALSAAWLLAAAVPTWASGTSTTPMTTTSAGTGGSTNTGAPTTTSGATYWQGDKVQVPADWSQDGAAYKAFVPSLDGMNQFVANFVAKFQLDAHQADVQKQQNGDHAVFAATPANAQDALAKAQAVIAANPGSKQGLAGLAIAQLALGNTAAAAQAAQQLAASDPDGYLTALVQARVAAAQGDNAQAAALDAKAVAANPLSGEAQRAYGADLLAQGDAQGAVAHLSVAAAVDPTSQDVYKSLDQALAKAKVPGVKVLVNGRAPAFDVKPFIKNDRTLVPIRAIAEALGAKVGWDEATQQVTISLGGHTVVLTIGSRNATVDGKPVTLDVPAEVAPGDRTVVPLRFVSEALKASVGWYGDSQLVTVLPQ